MARRKWFSFESREFYEDSAGVNPAWWVTHLSVGRECNDDSPYLIANEWIAGNIAAFLRLPIPPFALVQSGPVKAMFDSLRFGKKEIPPKDMRPGPCVRNDPRLCTGILLFDILVANGDRHRGNLKVDKAVDPKEFHVFDHDRALFGIEEGKGQSRLESKLDGLGVSDAESNADSQNCFLTTLNTTDYFGQWFRKISEIPAWFIDEICDEADYWISADEVSAAKKFLTYRKEKLSDIVWNHRAKFTAIKKQQWGLFQ